MSYVTSKTPVVGLMREQRTLLSSGTNANDSIVEDHVSVTAWFVNEVYICNSMTNYSCLCVFAQYNKLVPTNVDKGASCYFSSYAINSDWYIKHMFLTISSIATTGAIYATELHIVIFPKLKLCCWCWILYKKMPIISYIHQNNYHPHRMCSQYLQTIYVNAILNYI